MSNPLTYEYLNDTRSVKLKTVTLGRSNDWPEYMNEPGCVIIGSRGRYFVADISQNRVLIYWPDGTPDFRVPMTFNAPYRLLYHDKSGLLFVFQYPDSSVDSPSIITFDNNLYPVSCFIDNTINKLLKKQRALYTDTYEEQPNRIIDYSKQVKGYDKAEFEGNLLIFANQSSVKEIPVDCFLYPEKSTEGIKFYRYKEEIISQANWSYDFYIDTSMDWENTECFGRKRKNVYFGTSDFQNNMMLKIENIGEATVKNPRLVCNSGVDWFSTQTILKSVIEDDMSNEEKVCAVWSFMCKNVQIGIAQHNFYLLNSSPTQFFLNSGQGSCGTHAFFASLARAAGIEAENGYIPYNKFAHVMMRFFYNGGDHYLDATFEANTNADNPEDGTKSVRGLVPLALDNEKIASIQDILEDPYILYRLNRLPHAIRNHLYYLRGLTAPIKWEGNKKSGYDDKYTMSFNLRPAESITYYFDFFGKHLGTYRPVKNVCNAIIRFVPTMRNKCELEKNIQTNNFIIEEAGSNFFYKVNDYHKPALLSWHFSSPFGICGGRISGTVELNGAAARAYYSSDGKNMNYLGMTKKSGHFTFMFDYAPELQNIINEYDQQNNVVRVGPPVFDCNLYLEVDGGSGAFITGIGTEIDVQVNEHIIPKLTRGKNVVEYKSDSGENAITRITHSWRENNEVKPPETVDEAIHPGDGKMIIGSEFIFKWKKAVDAIEYEFFLSDRSDLKWPLTTCFHTFTNCPEPELLNPGPTYMTPGKVYYWRVRPMNARGMWGEWSKTFSFAFNGPERVMNACFEDNQKILAWNSPEKGTRIDYYEIYGSNETGFIPALEPFQVALNGMDKNGEYRTATYPATFISTVMANESKTNRFLLPGGDRAKCCYRIVSVDIHGNRSNPSSCFIRNIPYVTNIPAARVKAGAIYNYQVKAVAYESEINFTGELMPIQNFRTAQLFYSFEDAPSWLYIHEKTGLVSGNIPAGAYGIFNVSVKVVAKRKSNGQILGEAKQEFKLDVY